MTYIAIEGVIGVGKTTLARYLQDELQGQILLEVFEENPFLNAFYQDRDRYAFQTQMFFLLSRYRQMRHLLQLRPPIISDYIFAKDALFARQTIRNDELMIYERVYSALSENILSPDLVVFLRADTPTLMHRIAIRDRSYERDMDESYIDNLRIAYEHYFADYDARRILRIDTNHLDIVNREEDRHQVLQRILSRLGEAPHQPALPGLDVAHETPLELELSSEQSLDEHQTSPALEPFEILLHQMTLQSHIGDMARGLAHYIEHHDAQAQSRVRHQIDAIMEQLSIISSAIGLETPALTRDLR